MRKSQARLFAERLLFEECQSAILLGDFAYAKQMAKFSNGRYWLCNHWVTKESEQCFYCRKKRYYRYNIPQQWE